MQLRYVTGLDVARLQAHLEVFAPNRKLDDHFTVYADLSNGGKALIRASQICIGHRNGLGIEVNGTKATLRWEQEEPERLIIHLPGQPDRAYWRGSVAANDGFLKDLPSDLMAEPTIPAGHAEGFHDAFARLHRCFEADVRAYLGGKPFACDGARYASVDDGVMGMRFLARAVESSAAGGSWVAM
jgi:predicted dehydrogenase